MADSVTFRGWLILCQLLHHRPRWIWIRANICLICCVSQLAIESRVRSVQCGNVANDIQTKIRLHESAPMTAIDAAWPQTQQFPPPCPWPMSPRRFSNY
jgi:hypothetical protein